MIKERGNEMFCSKCGKEIEAGAMYCAQCGNQVEKTKLTSSVSLDKLSIFSLVMSVIFPSIGIVLGIDKFIKKQNSMGVIYLLLGIISGVARMLLPFPESAIYILNYASGESILCVTFALANVLAKGKSIKWPKIWLLIFAGVNIFNCILELSDTGGLSQVDFLSLVYTVILVVWSFYETASVNS